MLGKPSLTFLTGVVDGSTHNATYAANCLFRFFRLGRGDKFFIVNGHKICVKGTRPFACPLCDYIASTRLACLHKHILTHIANTQPCTLCGKLLNTVAKHETHMMFHRIGRKTCETCGKRVLNYGLHKMIHLENRQTFSCILCDKKYLYREQLKIHIDQVHKQTLYTCEICGKLYTNKQYHKFHLEGHYDAAGRTCKRCNKVYKNAKTFAQHSSICGKTRIRAVCDVCGKEYRTLEGLRLHLRVHLGQKEYSCKFCDKRFSKSSFLTAHTRVHTKEKPYVCPHCGKAFSQRSPLVIHIRSHTGERPYECLSCPMKFTCKLLLDLHKKIHSSQSLSINK